jgi:hypothetical protein
MKHVDYLSTVSGGGYVGSAYSCWRRRRIQEPEQSPTSTDTSEATPAAFDELLSHLRKFSNFISPRLGLGAAELWRIIGTMVRNLSLHWTVLLSAVVGVFALALLTLQHSFLATGVFALAGLILIGRGWWRERQAKTNPDNIEARTLLQAPHLCCFSGSDLGPGLALAFIQSTCAERHGRFAAVGVLSSAPSFVTVTRPHGRVAVGDAPTHSSTHAILAGIWAGDRVADRHVVDSESLQCLTLGCAVTICRSKHGRWWETGFRWRRWL